MDLSRCAVLLCCFLLSSLANALAEEWYPVPFISQEIRDAGVTVGGEGCQVILAIDADPVDGQFMLMGTNTGGLFRSDNAGELWEPANVGFDSRGAGDFAIDPRNIDRVIATGVSASLQPDHGLYLSTDRARTWKSTVRIPYRGNERRDQLAYDPTSYDEGLGYCRVAYWAFGGGPDEEPRIFRTTDGGKTWDVILYGFEGAWLDVDPLTGHVYYAGPRGLIRSTDAGEVFRPLADGAFTGLSLVPTSPLTIYACTADTVLKSTDGGETFSASRPEGIVNPKLKRIATSPADPDRVIIDHQYDDGWWQHHKYVSHDGGKTWQSGEDYDNSLSFMPRSERDSPFCWHPRDPNVIYSVGGDCVYLSTDGGLSWQWHSNGYNGVMVGRSFQFNLHHPDVIAFGCQDKNGAITLDGGWTFEYCNFSGKTHGHAYGAMAGSPDIVFGGLAPSWGGRRELVVSRNGGKSFDKTGIELSGAQVSYVDPLNQDIVFCFDQRSEDLGRTWTEIPGCDGVFIHNFENPSELFGRHGSTLVASTDHGRTWPALVDLPGEITDVAYNHGRDLFFIAVEANGFEGRCFTWKRGEEEAIDITEAIPADQFGNHRIRTVAVNPQRPDDMYVAGGASRYSNDNSVIRSQDAGRTWSVLTRSPRFDNSKVGIDGGRMASWVRVHPVTQDLWVVTGCFGVWRFARGSLEDPSSD